MSHRESLTATDCHSHFFPNAFGPDSDPGLYLNKSAQIGVSRSIISPSPTPRIELKNGTRFPCLWKWNTRSKKFIYVDRTVDHKDEIISEEAVMQNPYHDINNKLYYYIEQQSTSTELFMAYLHHPKLDTSDEVESWLRKPIVKAIKIHGISSATSPADVHSYLPFLAKKYNKPLIVHTDYSSRIATPIDRLYSSNNPENWITWALKNHVRLFVTHAARLSISALSQINQNDTLRLGCAPDIVLLNEPNRLVNKSESIYEFVLPRINPQRLLFDIDYGWNVRQRDAWDNNDWSGLDRLNRSLERYGLTSMADHVLSSGALSFFRLSD